MEYLRQIDISGENLGIELWCWAEVFDFLQRAGGAMDAYADGPRQRIPMNAANGEKVLFNGNPVPVYSAKLMYVLQEW